jgi:flagellar biosynthesis chaperone FliJ
MSYATLRFRAKAAGIKKLIAVLAAQGKVASQSTTAEDLAGPIADTAKQLAMLTDYRSKLEALRARPNNDVDALIKLNRELADTQSQIEALTGQQAHLVQRVETEILNVTISSYQSQSFWSPIGESFSDFGGHLSEGVATAITALAYIIPWGLVVWLIVWVVRKLWRGRKRNQPAG